jgi:hypothetical protein
VFTVRAEGGRLCALWSTRDLYVGQRFRHVVFQLESEQAA